MATKIFDMGLMVCEDVQAYVGSCKLMEGTGTDRKYIEANDAAFVRLGGLCKDETYSYTKGIENINYLDYNCYEADIPTDTEITDFSKLAVLDISAVSNGVIAGNTYKIGSKLVDLKMAAGFPARFRKMCKGDKFWLGEGSFDGVPGVGDYVTLQAGVLKEAITVNTGIKILATKPIILGAQANQTNTTGTPVYEQLYLCEVV